jgi:hypothetical protein
MVGDTGWESSMSVTVDATDDQIKARIGFRVMEHLLRYGVDAGDGAVATVREFAAACVAEAEAENVAEILQLREDLAFAPEREQHRLAIQCRESARKLGEWLTHHTDDD